jgi:two-component system, NarL family, response regulator YdfI
LKNRGANDRNLIRVLVCADTSAELDELEAFVREAASLQLSGSSLGRAGLEERIANASPDVVLEYWAPDDSDETTVARVLLVEQSDFAAASAAMQAQDSIAALLPAWSTGREIRVAIEAVAEGLLVLHPEIADGGPDSPPHTRESYDEALSPRETQVLNLLSAGLGNKEIASRLKISEHTVKFHVTSIFNKLNASTRAEAVAIGTRRGFIIL